jgi:hypothetical protein
MLCRPLCTREADCPVEAPVCYRFLTDGELGYCSAPRPDL